MNSTPRETLGPYRIIGPLGAGGMGEVYAAHDPSLGRSVAIKVLPQRFSGDRESLSRFTREARSASALNHPNIVTIHEVGTDNGTPYIVMEHIEGTDLRTLLRGGPLHNRRTMNIAAQIADGLGAAHEKGIVHRDLKPENVMVTKDGFVKILDFGLAKLIAPYEDDAETAQWDFPATNPGTIVGTVGYMSPEQAHGRPLDFRSDQFSLGAILYELATGKPAFAGENALDTMTAIVREEPKPIHDFNRQAPPAFCHVVEKLLAKDPAHRYDSTRDAARDLHNIHDAFASTIAVDEIPRPPLVKRRTLLASAVVAAVLIVGAAGITILYNRTVPVQEAPAPAKKYVAVQFKDLTNDPSGQLVVDGLSETLAARLARFSSVQVMRPTTADALAGASPQQVAHVLGANIVLTGSMQRAGEQLRVAYEVLDVTRNTRRSAELIEGSTGDLFNLQDKLAESVATALQLGTPTFRTAAADTSVSQRRYLEALGYLRRYDNEESVDHAIQILTELAASSSSASVQAALGRAYLYKFQLSHDPKWATPAAVACENGLRNDPENFELRIALGQLRRLTGRTPDAIAELKQALAQQPSSAEATLELAEAYKAAGDRAHAEISYKKAIQLQPNYWSGYNKLGAFYFANNSYTQAAQQFEKATHLVPDNIRARINLAGAYQGMGRYAEAAATYQEILAKHPTDQAYSNLGTCYYTLGRYNDAAAVYSKATAMSPNSYRYWANLGDAYRWIPGSDKKEGEAYDRAIGLAKKQIELNGRDASARSRLAECLAKRGRIPEARAQIRAALDIDPNDVQTMYRAAIVAMLDGKDTEAVKWLGKYLSRGSDRVAMERDPEFAVLRQKPIFREITQPSTTMVAGPQ
jgi:tetratricopeptide (TPR) repeat protein